MLYAKLSLSVIFPAKFIFWVPSLIFSDNDSSKLFISGAYLSGKIGIAWNQ